jgi:hypothetical protein
MVLCVAARGIPAPANAALQDALASQTARPEFLALVDRLLATLSTAVAAPHGSGRSSGGGGSSGELERACLSGTLRVLGRFALGCARNQDVLLWGAPPTPLVRLCRLPLR